MQTESYQESPPMPIPPFDPREQPVKARPLLPLPSDVARAKAVMFRERSDYVRHAAKRDGLEGLQALVDVYGDEALAVLIEYDRMCDTDGPATMSRLLNVFRFERGER